MKKTSEETIVINKNKVYTSYYARACKIIPDYKLIAISIGIPENFGGEIMRELNPSQNLLYSYKKGNISDSEYENIYFNETLKSLDANIIYNRLKGKVILCYCGKESFCHRHLVLKWLEQELGKDVIGYEI